MIAIKERTLLRGLLVLIIVTYGAIGRDLFHSRMSGAAGTDAIGEILVYLRFGSAMLAVVTCLLLSRSLKPFLTVPVLLLPYIVIVLASSLWSEDAKNTLRAAILLGSFIPAVAMLSWRLGIADTIGTLMGLLAATLIASFLFATLVPSIGRHQGSDLVQNVHAGRWRGIFDHKNGLGPHAAYGFLLFWLYPKLLGRAWLRWIALGSALACLLFAGSATSMVGAAAMATLGGLFLAHRAVPGVPFKLIFAAGLALFVLAGALISESDLLFQVLGRDETLTGRTYLWELAVLSIREAPLFGFGYSSFGGTVFNGRVVAYFGDITGPESSYFNIVMETGFVGALALLVPIAVIVSFAFRRRSETRGVEQQAYEASLLILIAALVMGVTETNPLLVTSYAGPFNFAIITCLATQRLVAAAQRARLSPVRRNGRVVFVPFEGRGPAPGTRQAGPMRREPGPRERGLRS